MSILSGFFKTKKLRRMADGNYKLQSEWTSSETVEMADGNTAEENLGSIKGITSSLASTDSGYALAADAGKDLQDQVNELNSNLGTYDYFEGTFATSFVKIVGKIDLSEFKNLLLALNNSSGCCLATTLIPISILKSIYNSQSKIVRAASPGTSDYYVADIYYDESSKSIYGRVSSGYNLQIYLQK